jgi:hypothetical protein
VLKTTGRNATFCYEQATDAAKKGRASRNAGDQAFWRDMETYWLRLATSLDYQDRLKRFFLRPVGRGPSIRFVRTVTHFCEQYGFAAAIMERRKSRTNIAVWSDEDHCGSRFRVASILIERSPKSFADFLSGPCPLLALSRHHQLHCVVRFPGQSRHHRQAFKARGRGASKKAGPKAARRRSGRRVAKKRPYASDQSFRKTENARDAPILRRYFA